MISNISVIGAGTMGHGIAECFAMYGYNVCLYESYEPIRNTVLSTIKEELEFIASEGLIPNHSVEETLSRITAYADLKEAVKSSDYVIEAIVEDVDQKRSLFQQLDAFCKPETILASNTSSIRLDDMSADVSSERKKLMMVCHWYNPAHLMPLVELSFYGNMSEDVMLKVEKLYASIQKKTVRVLKDVPGMVANRLQHGLVRQAFSLIDDGVCSPKDVDIALMYSSAFRYATTGILEAADMGGLDIWYQSHKNILPYLAQNVVPSKTLKKKMEEGKLGIKTGEGFYYYQPEDVLRIKNEFQKRLITQLKASKQYEKNEL
jgi:3-hydroxybutyryl-CoA dehydrogenase